MSSLTGEYSYSFHPIHEDVQANKPRFHPGPPQRDAKETTRPESGVLSARIPEPMDRTVLIPKEQFTKNVPRTQLHDMIDGSN